MNKHPSLLIQFDDAWTPTVLINGMTDVQEVKLKEIADKMLGTIKFDPYFKVGVSDDYILLRDDFPIESISPGDFSKLCEEMFRRNERALSYGEK
jgi:hypothetical protein